MSESCTGVEVPVTMTIAGSDSGGGAGIQTDLKTFSALGCFGTSAVTCITAQNPSEVRAVEAVSVEMILQQIDAVLDEFPVAAVKTGMLYSPQIVEAVAERLKFRAHFHVVVDPVMIATAGDSLFNEEALSVMREMMMPVSTIVTPNIPEAEALLSHKIFTIADMEDAAAQISSRWKTACLLKGGHCESDQSGVITDILSLDGKIERFTAERVDAEQTHGTGCTCAAALTAFLAHGNAVPVAVKKALLFVQSALKAPFKTGDHYPLGIRPLCTADELIRD